MVVFSLFIKPRHSNERSTKFESLEQEQKYFEEPQSSHVSAMGYDDDDDDLYFKTTCIKAAKACGVVYNN